MRTGFASGPGLGMAIMLTFTGLTHFITPKTFDAIVPKFLPADPRLWTYLSGVAELVVALMLAAPSKALLLGVSIRLIGGYSAFALFLAVFPANINMAVMWSSRAMPAPLFAYARLPLQFGLFYWSWAIIKAIKG